MATLDIGNFSLSLQNLSEALATRFSLKDKDLDVLYLFLAGDIVLFLQAGFAFMECGIVRSKNTMNILIKNLLDLFISGVAFWVLGYAFTRGAGNAFIGYTNFATVGLDDFTYAAWFFDYVFASTASTIISGAVAERCEFIAYLSYSFFVTGLVYPVEAHWCWQDGGWLFQGDGFYHFIDYSGSGVVHMCGGVCAFVGTAVLGPRIGRFDSLTRKPKEIKGHSLPFVALGGFILIFGIVAFNGGSQAHISQPGDGRFIAVIIANTILTGSFGGLTALLISKLGILGETGRWNFLSTLNGSIIAMIAVCAGGERMSPWAAAILGVISAFWFFLLREFVVKLRIDDPLDVVPVHFGGGFLGLIYAGIVSKEFSWIYGPGDRPYMWLVWNVIGAFSIIAWAGGCSFLLFMFLKKIKMFRVSPEMELKGMDMLKHGTSAYPSEGWAEEQYSVFTVENAVRLTGIHPVMSQPKLNPKHEADQPIAPTLVINPIFNELETLAL